jgi:hypothetical protein
MRTLPAATLGILLQLAGCNPQSDAKTERDARPPPSVRSIVLSASDYAKLGVETTPAREVSYTPRVRGYGVVLNTATLAQMDADIQAAEAQAGYSRAALARDRALFGKTRAPHAISQDALDAALRLSMADEAQRALTDRREAAAFGQHAPWRGPPRDETLLSKLTSGTSLLVQATFPLGVSLSQDPSALIVTHLNPSPGKSGGVSETVWSSPSDPTIPGESFYALVAAGDFEQGEHVLVYAATGPEIQGVRVPSEAIVIADEKAWCYVLVAPRAFRRVAIDLSRPIEGGYFAQGSIGTNQPVLTKGTGLLLARELGVTASYQD